LVPLWERRKAAWVQGTNPGTVVVRTAWLLLTNLVSSTTDANRHWSLPPPSATESTVEDESTVESRVESICAPEPTVDDKPTTESTAPSKAHLVKVVAVAN
jgi:hypothetical protein